VAEQTGIEWTDTTWNVVTGCTKVSPGCDHCYAETFAERWRGTPGHHFETGFDLTVRPERVGLPLRWRRGRLVFVNSMADLFHDQVNDDFVAEVYAVMAVARHHTFQVLTKRHARMRHLLSDPGFADTVWAEVATLAHEDIDISPAIPWGQWPLPNVWLGVSVENQQWADIRVPALAATPAAHRFLSCEPLLGPVDLSRWLHLEFSDMGLWLPEMLATLAGRRPAVDWVIVGGESGPGARPIDEWWIGDLIDQAHAADLPVFVKQLGTAWATAHGQRGKGTDPNVWPAELRVRDLPGTDFFTAPMLSRPAVTR